MSDQPTFYNWLEEFEPQANELDEDASFEGCLYETHGAQLEHVLAVNAQDPSRVWTLLEVEGDHFLSAGLQQVNAFGYFITERGLDMEDAEQRDRYADKDIPVDE